MHDERGWSELHALQDDETLPRFVRLLRNAYQARHRPRVPAEAARLLVAFPMAFQASQMLLRRLSDVGELSCVTSVPCAREV
jgi:hypothetical protein